MKKKQHPRSQRSQSIKWGRKGRAGRQKRRRTETETKSSQVCDDTTVVLLCFQGQNKDLKSLSTYLIWTRWRNHWHPSHLPTLSHRNPLDLLWVLRKWQKEEILQNKQSPGAGFSSGKGMWGYRDAHGACFASRALGLGETTVGLGWNLVPVEQSGWLLGLWSPCSEGTQKVLSSQRCSRATAEAATAIPVQWKDTGCRDITILTSLDL